MLLEQYLPHTAVINAFDIDEHLCAQIHKCGEHLSQTHHHSVNIYHQYIIMWQTCISNTS